MSFTSSPHVAAYVAVAAPSQAVTTRAVGPYSSSGDVRSIRYTPAVTSVAAWIRADTGVGV